MGPKTCASGDDIGRAPVCESAAHGFAASSNCLKCPGLWLARASPASYVHSTAWAHFKPPGVSSCGVVPASMALRQPDDPGASFHLTR